MKKEEIKSEEKINLRKIENEAQLGNVMNEDNELLFGCGSGSGSGSGSGCGCGCGSGCGCGCGCGSGCGCGCGCGGIHDTVLRSGSATKKIFESTTGNYRVTVSGEINVSVSEVVAVDEDGTVVGYPRITGSMSGYIVGSGGTNEVNNIKYTTTGFSQQRIGRSLNGWSAAEYLYADIMCSNSKDTAGHNATLTINVHYSIKPGSSNGSIDVTVSGLS